MTQLDRISGFLGNGMLSAEAFKGWLFLRDLDQEVGIARDPYSCPLSRWLEHLGAQQTEVTLENIAFLYHGQPFSMPTPAWTATFIHAVDELADSGVWLISARQALAIIETLLLAQAA